MGKKSDIFLKTSSHSSGQMQSAIPILGMGTPRGVRQERSSPWQTPLSKGEVRHPSSCKRLKGLLRTQRWGTQPSLVVTESLPNPRNRVTKGCDGLMDSKENSITWSVKPPPLNPRGRGNVSFDHHSGWYFNKFLFSLFPSLPIIVYMEGTECLLFGMVLEELSLHVTKCWQGCQLFGS